METLHSAFRFLVVMVEVLLLVNLMIGVHELGHFLAALWRGMTPTKFAIWFGPAIWKRTIRGVEYRLGCVPLGGYVALPQMISRDRLPDSATVPELPPAKPRDKFIVALAGPAFSLGLAFCFGLLVWIVGIPAGEAEQNTTIGYVAPDSFAAKAPCDDKSVQPGLHAGDEILRVDGHPVHSYAGEADSVVWYIARTEGDRIAFEVQRGGKTLTFRVRPTFDTTGDLRSRQLPQVSILPMQSAVVARVTPGSPGDRAGLRPGDYLVSAKGQRVYHPAALYDAVERSEYGQPIGLSATRAGKAIWLTLPPMPLVLSGVLPGGPADRAGVRAGDTITAINGGPLRQFTDFAASIAAHAGQPVELTALRGGKEEHFSITPLVPKGRNRAVLGIESSFSSDGISWQENPHAHTVHRDPVYQIHSAVAEIGNTIGAVAAPKSRLSLRQLGGPVFIGQTFYAIIVSPAGWRLALAFMVVFNVNLAVLNLLPLPALDGGHIMFAIIESLRGKPLGFRWVASLQMAFLGLIGCYMLYVTFFDVNSMLASGQGTEWNEPFASPSPAPAHR